jgi:hypothetical protein
MEAVAHNPSFAKKVGVPQSVGQDFSNADKGRKFSKGGNTMAEQMDPRVMKMMLDIKRKQDMNSQMMPSVSRTGMGAGLSGGLSSTGMKKGGMAKFERSAKDKEYGIKEGSKKDMMMDKKQMMGMSKGGMHKMPDGKMMKDSAMNYGGSVKKMASGGMPMTMKDGKKVPAFAADGQGKMKHGGAVKKMASGGLAAGHKSADGIAQRGKTKGKEVAMKRGGKC